jgi:putative tricarboxylic transport membrane protein
MIAAQVQRASLLQASRRSDKDPLQECSTNNAEGDEAVPVSGSKALKLGWQIACLCLLGVFLPALVTSLGYALTDALGPGPGFFPFWLSLIGAVLSAAILAQVTLAGTGLDKTDQDIELSLVPERRVALQAIGVLIALTAAAALFEPLGYRLTMLPFIVGLLLILGARSPIAILLTALAGSFGVFHVFYHWLKVPLPIGEFGL